MSGDTISRLLANKAIAEPITKPGSTSLIVDDVVGEELVAIGQCRLAARPQMMVAFHKCSGAVEVYPYAMLSQIKSDDPNRKFEMQFGPTRIAVQGKNLLRLFHYVCEHRVLAFGESDREATFGTSDEANHVLNIEIIRKSE